MSPSFIHWRVAQIPVTMLKQFFWPVCISAFAAPLRSKIALSIALSAIAVLAGGMRPGAIAYAGQTSTATTKLALLQEFPRHTAALHLGNTVATSYRVYCGQEGEALTEVVMDRSLCETVSMGGGGVEYDVPVSQPIGEPFWQNNALQEPMVLQQYDKAQFLPR
ncbi:MAG: hypothetical protein NW220_02765 [Leptolyngbyaceae cyanobacterium bins.349]|nr:hypothetical protein [Leptolyngbyaceae cyanobacterium bins.349]